MLIMARRWLIFPLLITVILLGRPVQLRAQDNTSAWFAYFLGLDGQFKRVIVRIDEAGTITIFDLNSLDDAASAHAFSPDGKFVAYCLSGDAITRLVLWEIEAEREVWSLDFGPSSGCALTNDSFSATGDQIAVGLSIGAEIAGENPRWRLVVLNVADGEIVTELNNQSPVTQTTGLDVLGDIILIPEVRYFASNQVIFRLRPSGVEQGDLRAYTWALDGDTIRTVDYWGSRSIAHLPATGELVWTAYDESLPASQPDAVLGNHNVVQIADQAGTHLVYHTADHIIMDAAFVEDGNALAIQLWTLKQGRYGWVMIGRNGEQTEILDDDSLPIIFAAPGGYMVMRRHENATGAQYTYTLELHRDGEVISLWDEASAMQYNSLAPFYSAPTQPTGDLTPFPAWEE